MKKFKIVEGLSLYGSHKKKKFNGEPPTRWTTHKTYRTIKDMLKAFAALNSNNYHFIHTYGTDVVRYQSVYKMCHKY